MLQFLIITALVGLAISQQLGPPPPGPPSDHHNPLQPLQPLEPLPRQEMNNDREMHVLERENIRENEVSPTEEPIVGAVFPPVFPILGLTAASAKVQGAAAMALVEAQALALRQKADLEKAMIDAKLRQDLLASQARLAGHQMLFKSAILGTADRNPGPEDSPEAIKHDIAHDLAGVSSGDSQPLPHMISRLNEMFGKPAKRELPYDMHLHGKNRNRDENLYLWSLNDFGRDAHLQQKPENFLQPSEGELQHIEQDETLRQQVPENPREIQSFGGRELDTFEKRELLVPVPEVSNNQPHEDPVTQKPKKGKHRRIYKFGSPGPLPDEDPLNEEELLIPLDSVEGNEFPERGIRMMERANPRHFGHLHHKHFGFHGGHDMFHAGAHGSGGSGLAGFGTGFSTFSRPTSVTINNQQNTFTNSVPTTAGNANFQISQTTGQAGSSQSHSATSDVHPHNGQHASGFFRQANEEQKADNQDMMVASHGPEVQMLMLRQNMGMASPSPTSAHLRQAAQETETPISHPRMTDHFLGMRSLMPHSGSAMAMDQPTPMIQ